MTAVIETPRRVAIENLAGFIAACSIFCSLAALAYPPVKFGGLGMFFGLVAAGMATRFHRLAVFACILAPVCFVGGLVVAVVTSKGLW